MHKHVSSQTISSPKTSAANFTRERFLSSVREAVLLHVGNLVEISITKFTRMYLPLLREVSVPELLIWKEQIECSPFMTHMIINSLPPGKFFHTFLLSADFFQNELFQKILSGIPYQCHTDWILIRPDVLSGLIRVQSVCKGYDQTTLGSNEFNRFGHKTVML